VEDPAATQEADETMAADPTAPRRRKARLERGSTIGRYLVADMLGSGGMGVVYAAYDPDLDRKLAIKLLHVGSAERAGDGTTRLLREAQALAKLTHPNVVAVHDVGTHEGTVFLAMEFVEGQTLGGWMRDGPRPWREVLRRFVPAGGGLAAAHAAGLVHRDFKPDNVLLGDDGRIRVADFGLVRTNDAEEDSRTASHEADTAVSASQVDAERLQDVSADHGLGVSRSQGLSVKLTRTGAMMGTPAYMAPEQHMGTHAGPKADQFAFCVALWEALYGSRPFRGDSVAALAIAITTGKVDEPPPGVSVPGWLRRVVVRGLGPQPEDRHPSMETLLAELSRERLTLRRHGLGVLAFTGLLGGSIALLSQGPEQPGACEGFDSVIAELWDPDVDRRLRAAFEGTGLVYATQSARRVATGLDAYAKAWVDQAEASCRATQRGQQSERLLDLREACLQRERRDVAALIDVLLQPDEATVRNAVDAVAGVSQLEACEDTERLLVAAAPPDDPLVAEHVRAVDDALARATALHFAGRYSEAREVADSAASTADAIDHPPLVARAHFAVAATTTAMADPEATRAAVRRSFTAGLAGGEDAIAARAAYHMLWTAAKGGDEDEVEHWASLSAALIERLEDDTARIDLASNHASALRRLGHLDEADARLEEALQWAEALHGKDSARVAHLLVNRGTVAWDRGDFVRTGEMSRRAHEIWKRQLGEEHPRTLQALMQVGLTAYREGDLERAEKITRRVVEQRRRIFGEGSRTHADALSNLAVILVTAGQREESVALHRQLVDVYAELDGSQSVSVGQVRANLAASLNRSDHLEEAIAEAEHAVQILEASLGSEHHHIAMVLMIRGEILREQGLLTRSLQDLERAMAISEAALGPDEPRLLAPLTQIALTQLDLGRPRDALTSIERGLRLAEGQPLPPGERGDLLFAHARASWDTQTDRDRARDLAREALAAYAEVPQSATREVAALRRWLKTIED
jgi:eukaryotic-like serine/threonine-protein kinase